MSIEAFAAHLGVSDRMVSKWEARGGTINLRPVNQAALDTALASSPPDARARFLRLTDSLGSVFQPGRTPHLTAPNRPRWRHPTDAKQMTLVGDGYYLSGTGDVPTHLIAFYIDVHPVTNAEYERFVRATGHRAPDHWRLSQPPADHPVVYVSWRDAAAYAAWAGKSLPTGRQWEKAARGPNGQAYPWGEQPTPAKCNTRETRIGTTTPVDRFHSGVSPYDVYDLCGNAWEWTSTESEPARYELKGGAWTSPFARALPSAFNDASADMRDDDTGFRCVAPAAGDAWVSADEQGGGDGGQALAAAGEAEAVGGGAADTDRCADRRGERRLRFVATGADARADADDLN
nr:SUMF1/EgtB/PvdO family nonheme iron enzyme [Jiangella endophytica]